MIGAPMTAHQELEQMDVIVRAVDRRGREMDQRWGIGRLTTIVPPELGEKFRVQRRKFSAATLDLNLEDVRKHGDAMLRAYAKLDELATATHGEPGQPEHWEFTVGVDEELIILVRDIADAGRVDLGGRQGQIWSLDEIASVIRNHPLIAAAKESFPGAVVETVRPPKVVRSKLNDELSDVPFAAG